MPRQYPPPLPPRVAALCLLFAASAHAATQCAGEGCAGVRPQDEVVLISSRPVGCSTDPTRLEEGLHAERFADSDGDGSRDWQTVPWRSVLASDSPGVPTVVYAHGNRISWGETRARGLYVLHHLTRCAVDERPVRLLIWSWNADEIPGPLADFRAKAARTAPVGKQLAYVINEMPADEPLSVMGYSYGARVASGALHELGAGALAGPTRSVRAFYIAPAFDSHWLGQGQRHGAAMHVTERVLMTVNCKDPAMRFYKLLPKGYHPQAMGYAGPTCIDRERSSRVRLVNAANHVGRSHDLCDYITTPGLMSKAWRLLTYADREAPAVEVAGASDLYAPVSQ